ncbi:MAG TPA: DUF1674 domain-containing protein [Stenotrophomonas sp.]|nr:DUF1674 domain-containing protein [Stenotrophomonas sp.]
MIRQTPPHPESDPEGAALPAEPSAPETEPAGPEPAEIGGRGGLDPVRYGDWEKNGRCIDF